jgi:hypothetical protein
VAAERISLCGAQKLKALSARHLKDLHLHDAEGIEDLDFCMSTVPLEQYAQLSLCKRLETLNLSGISANVDDVLRHVSGLNQLQRLDLSYTPVTAAGLRQLVGLRKLNELAVSLPLDAATLAELKKLVALREVTIVGTRASDRDIAEIKSAIPGLCHIGFRGSNPTAPETVTN